MSTFEKLLEILETGNGSDGKKKEVVFAPTLVLETLSKGEVKQLVRGMKTTRIKVISFPIHSGQSCDAAKSIPKRLRRLLGDDCLIGIIRRKRGGSLTFIPAELFRRRWAKNDVVDCRTERIE